MQLSCDDSEQSKVEFLEIDTEHPFGSSGGDGRGLAGIEMRATDSCKGVGQPIHDAVDPSPRRKKVE